MMDSIRSRQVLTATVLLLAAGCANRPLQIDAATVRSCGASFELLPGGSCLALPPEVGPNTPVILYLHGMYRASAPEQGLAEQERVARAATAMGMAVLAPQGQPGLCDWSADLADWRCWPSLGRQKPEAGRLLVTFGPDFRGVSNRLGLLHFEPFVMGFSNGGFFAAMIAADTRLPVAAYAILHAGPAEPATFGLDRAAPVFLLAAADDGWQRPKMERLHALLDEAGWPHRHQVRAGSHALTTEDIAAALEFFATAGTHRPSER